MGIPFPKLLNIWVGPLSFLIGLSYGNEHSEYLMNHTVQSWNHCKSAWDVLLKWTLAQSMSTQFAVGHEAIHTPYKPSSFQWLLSWSLHREKGYLLPTWVQKITCWCFDWILQLSSGWKWKKCEQTLLFIPMHYWWYMSLEVKGWWGLLFPPCLLISLQVLILLLYTKSVTEVVYKWLI